MSLGTQKHIFADFTKARQAIYKPSWELKNFEYFKGILAPTFTPMSKDSYSLNSTPLEDYSKSLVSQNVSAIFQNGTTGQSTSLSFDERKTSLEAWMNTNAVKDRKLRVIAHVGGNSITEMIALAKHAEAKQVDAISAFVPCYYKPKNAVECAELCIRLAHETPNTPFYFYYFPGMNGVVCSAHDVLVMARKYAPNVVGVKFTDAKFSEVRLCKSQDFNVLVGAAEHLSYALAAGADGCIGTMHNWSGKLHHNIYNSWMAGDNHLADRYAAHSTDMAKAIEDTGNIFSARAYTFEKFTGFDLGHFRYPLHNLEEDKRAQLDKFYETYDMNPKLN